MNKTTKLFIEIIAVVVVAAGFGTYISIAGKNSKPNYAEKIAASVTGDAYLYATETPAAIYDTPVVPDTAPMVIPDATAAQSDAVIATSAPVADAPIAAQTQAQVTAAPAAQDVSTLSKAQIISLLAEAVNKTKAYTGEITVQHSEDFTANIEQITGGSAVKSVAQKLMTSVVKPSQETLSFRGGSALNGEGEAVRLLLPQAGNFTLGENGVASASASMNGQNTVVNLTLVSETVGMNDVPPFNASAIGYLDVGSLDLSLLKVTKADIVYTGSTIQAQINPEGYITTVAYTIPLHVEGAASAMGISATATFSGQEVETWTLNW